MERNIEKEATEKLAKYKKMYDNKYFTMKELLTLNNKYPNL